MTRRVGLLFGGRSVEHEVSLISARGVAAAMRETDLICVPIGVTGDGAWLGVERSTRILEGQDRRVESEGDTARTLLDPGSGRLTSLRCGAIEPLDADVIFPLLHGHGGEDGRAQGALETVGIPYVGAGVLGSALAMDKVVAKEVARANGIPVVPWLTLRAAEREADPAGSARRVAEEIGFPAFVKPANGGSSVGVSRVDSPADLEPALEDAFGCDAKVLVERGIDAREIECAVLGDTELEVSVPGEVVPSGRFYDYAAKYLDDSSGLILPAVLDPATSEGIRGTALRAFRCLELSGFARVDFLLDRRDGAFYLNEINTLPGFTPISMFPKLWEASGLAYPRLIERLVRLAEERWVRQRQLRTRRTEA